MTGISSVGRDWLGRLGNQRSQLVLRQPFGIGVARVTEAFRKNFSLGNNLALPPRVARRDHIAIVKFEAMPRFILGEQDFVKFLSRADSDGGPLAAWRKSVGE